VKAFIHPDILTDYRRAVLDCLPGKAIPQWNGIPMLISAAGCIEDKIFSLECPNSTGGRIQQVASQFCQVGENLLAGLCE
jgi:hypothetical protein